MKIKNEDPIEKGFQDDILIGIDEVKAYLEKNRTVDEYVYLLLWRPIEWMLDYYAYLDAKKNGISYEEFWKEQSKNGVDKKVKYFETDAKYENIYNEIYFLRDFRNRSVLRYSLVCDNSVFEKFDLICKDFYKRTDRKTLNHKRTASYDIKIEINQYFDQEDEIASEGDIELFYNIINELKSSRKNPVILACKMESLAQRYAENLLIERGFSFAYTNKEDKNGLYILKYEDGDDDPIYIKILTYIDYLVENKVSKSAIRTKDALSTIRDSRNEVIHNARFDDYYVGKLEDLWLYLMQEYFCDNDAILQIIREERKKNISVDDVIETLKIYVDLNKEYLSEGLFEEINSNLVITQKVLSSTNSFRNQYMDKIDEASTDEEKELIREEYFTKIDEQYYEFKCNQSKADIEKYNLIIQQSLGNEDNIRINDKTREYLRTALIFRDMITRRSRYTEGIDYAGVCIELTRAVELFLFDNIFVKYKNFRQNKYSSNDEDDKLKSLGKKYRDDNITLGDYKKIFGIEDNSPESDKEDYLEFSDKEKIYKVSFVDVPAVIEDEGSSIDEIKIKYRDKCAHRLGISSEVMDACFEEIFYADESLIKKLLHDMN